jgi:hemolysin D
MLEGLRRHWAILKDSWSIETERQRNVRPVGETAFLPAALEIIERPPSPTARVTTWLLLGLTGSAIAWSCLAKVDVVAVAPGKLVPADKVKVVQSSEGGIVRAIHVRDGDRVRAGQVLVELDPTMSAADAAQASTALLKAQVEAARHRAVLGGLASGAARFVPPANAPREIAAMEQSLVDARLAEFTARTAGLRDARAAAATDRAGAAEQVAKYEESLPIYEQQMAARKTLLDKGFTPKLLYMEMQQRHVEMTRDRNAAVERRSRAALEIAGLDQQMAEAKAQARGQVLADLAAAEAEVRLRREELTKAAQRSALQRVTAPVDGTVQQLTLATLGGVVEAAKPLMVVVPSSSRLVVEAALLNKDAGLVRAGDPVAVKLEAFPFTRYGTAAGELIQVSSDAVQDERLGLVYPVRASIAASTNSREGSPMKLAPGLAASLEIKAGERRVIEFLLSPIARSVREAGREL